MGLLDFLSPALTATTQGVSGYEQGQGQGSQLLRAIMTQQLDADQKRAAIAHLVAQTAGEQHRNQAPVLGEPGYNAAKAGEAGAVAGATEPIHTQGAIDTANGTLPAKKDLAQFEAGLHEGSERRLIGARTAEQNANPAHAAAIAQPFIRQNQTLAATAQPYAQAKVAFREAKAGNPAALKSAIVAFAAVADPKAQLRQGMLNYISKVDPSVSGSFEMAVDRLASGKLPPRVIADMERLVDAVQATNRALYEQRRAAYVKHVPQAADFIPESAELFDVPGAGANPASAGGSGALGDTATHESVATKYGLPPVRGAKP